MICQKCNENRATVHLLKILNGNKQEIMLCEKCANELTNIPSIVNFEELDEFKFQKLVSGFIDYMNNSKSEGNKYEKLTCNNCNTTYKDFRDTGLLGCSKCYEVFSDMINPVIKRIQGDVEHIGKIPKKSSEYIIYKRKLLKLKSELQDAILVEEYENAAKIRDEIKKLTNSIKSREDGNNEQLDTRKSSK